VEVVMLRVGGVILALAVYIWTVVDTIRTPSAIVRTLPKAVWLLIVILLPLIGTVLWILFGRPRRERRKRRRGQVAPDDDPNFLRQLDQEAWSQRMRRRRGEGDGGSSPDSQPKPA
jgi:hypothetical protein